MSKFTFDLINNIAPYVPGEQPQDRRYIKLNTNENPYYTSPEAVSAVTAEAVKNLNRYSDPESRELTAAIADFYGVKRENVLVTNGSDEALAFAFFAYGRGGVCYPDVTYGFYDVIANLYGCAIEHIPLKSDFTIDASEYFYKQKTVVIANPNAQTGVELSAAELESIIINNSNNVVIVDQAYADFGTYNAVGLINRYENLVVVNTFSKSRSLAGARVGFVIADARLIDDLKKVKNSFHPYNVNRLSATLAAKAIADKEYFEQSVKKVVATRVRLSGELIKMGFEVLPSAANFVLARTGRLSGGQLYKKLKEKGVLVRHFSDERIADYVRISVGTEAETNALLDAIKQILKENK